MKRNVETAVVAVLTALILKAVERIPNIQWLWQTFFVELWLLWLAVGVGAVYWLARDYMGLRRTVKRLEVEPHNRGVYIQNLSDLMQGLEGRITKLEMKNG